MFKLAKKLDKLLAADNRIIIPRRTPLISSRTLRTLMLSNNGIDQLYKQTFIMVPTLEVLYLDSNKIRSITPIFNTLPNLKYLHLGKNYLTSIPPKNFVSPSLIYYITKSQEKAGKRAIRHLNHHFDHYNRTAVWRQKNFVTRRFYFIFSQDNCIDKCSLLNILKCLDILF